MGPSKNCQDNVIFIPARTSLDVFTIAHLFSVGAGGRWLAVKEKLILKTMLKLVSGMQLNY